MDVSAVSNASVTQQMYNTQAKQAGPEGSAAEEAQESSATEAQEQQAAATSAPSSNGAGRGLNALA